MVAYNFQSQFVDAIRSGEKSHTIRRLGKRRHARPGETLQLYMGMRTKRCAKIIPDPECLAVMPISIHIETAKITRIDIGRSILTSMHALHAFAINDGFPGLTAMSEFWQKFHGQPLFTGLLIAWQPKKDHA